jgi:hypothetical protein
MFNKPGLEGVEVCGVGLLNKSDLSSTSKYDQSHINYCYEFGNFITPKAAPRHELLFNKLALSKKLMLSCGFKCDQIHNNHR